MVHHKKLLAVVFISIILIEQCIPFPQMALQSILSQPQSSLHEFRAPGPNDIRGPCPGLNTAANHGYISRNGITTFAELVQMQQDLFNFDLILSTLLATVGVVLDGDIITGKLSIGRKSSDVPGLLNTPGGLNQHNTFEGDTSLTRNDYFLANGNNFEFNGTLYGMMHDVAQQFGGLYNREAMALYRYQRYEQSLSENPQFQFSPLALLLFGAASFLYQAFPNGTDMLPTETVISSFFGAHKNAAGQWESVPERIPPNWVRRQTPYTVVDVALEILTLFLKYPVLFGGNTGSPNSFVPLNFKFPPGQSTVNGIVCFLYQTVLGFVPTEINSVVIKPLEIVNFILAKLDPLIGVQFGCPSGNMNLNG